MTPRESGCADDCCHPDHRHAMVEAAISHFEYFSNPEERAERCVRDILAALPQMPDTHEGHSNMAAVTLAELMPLVVPPAVMGTVPTGTLGQDVFEMLRSDTHDEWRRLNTDAE